MSPTAEAAISESLIRQAPARASGGAQRLLLAALRGYRRWVSGRGPLRGLRCTFEQTESCGAYGLRVAEQAPGARAALRLIRGRLRRCGSSRLHFDRDLLWGEAYDARCPEELIDWAADQAELPQTQAMLARAARVVERERWPSAGAVQRALGAPRVLLRGGDGSLGQRFRLKWALCLWLPAVAALGLLCLWSLWFVPGLAMAGLLGLAQLWGAQRSALAWRERVATLRAAREFEVY